jgi:hypothetical protein
MGRLGTLVFDKAVGGLRSDTIVYIIRGMMFWNCLRFILLGPDVIWNSLFISEVLLCYDGHRSVSCTELFGYTQINSYAQH